MRPTEESAAEEHSLTDWLLREVLPVYVAYKAAPQSGVSLDEVKAELAERHRQAMMRD